MTTPLRLDLRHYETVAAIVEHGSMTAAARQLSVTQSALSHRLAEAERRLGVTLFARGVDRRLSATSHGVAVHQAARRALGDLARLEHMLVGAASEVRVTLRIGVGGYDCFHWYPGLLSTLRDERPDIELDLIAVGDAPGPLLSSRSVDLVIAPGEPSGDHELTAVLDDELVLVCAPDHRLAGVDVIEARDLIVETYLTYNARPSPGFEYDRFIRPSDNPPRIVRVVRQTSAIIELVAARAGVSILSRWATAAAVAAGRLVAIRCGVDGLPITWHAVHRRGDEVAAEVTTRLPSHLTGHPQ